MYLYPSFSFILPLRHILVIPSQLFHSTHSFTEKIKKHTHLFFLQSICNQGQNSLLWHTHVAVVLS